MANRTTVHPPSQIPPDGTNTPPYFPSTHVDTQRGIISMTLTPELYDLLNRNTIRGISTSYDVTNPQHGEPRSRFTTIRVTSEIRVLHTLDPRTPPDADDSLYDSPTPTAPAKPLIDRSLSRALSLAAKYRFLDLWIDQTTKFSFNLWNLKLLPPPPRVTSEQPDNAALTYSEVLTSPAKSEPESPVIQSPTRATAPGTMMKFPISLTPKVNKNLTTFNGYKDALAYLRSPNPNSTELLTISQQDKHPVFEIVNQSNRPKFLGHLITLYNDMHIIVHNEALKQQIIASPTYNQLAKRLTDCKFEIPLTINDKTSVFSIAGAKSHIEVWHTQLTEAEPAERKFKKKLCPLGLCLFDLPYHFEAFSEADRLTYVLCIFKTLRRLMTRIFTKNDLDTLRMIDAQNASHYDCDNQVVIPPKGEIEPIRQIIYHLTGHCTCCTPNQNPQLKAKLIDNLTRHQREKSTIHTLTLNRIYGLSSGSGYTSQSKTSIKINCTLGTPPKTFSLSTGFGPWKEDSTKFLSELELLASQ
jgi:hypothetical protein